MSRSLTTRLAYFSPTGDAEVVYKLDDVPGVPGSQLKIANHDEHDNPVAEVMLDHLAIQALKDHASFAELMYSLRYARTESQIQDEIKACVNLLDVRYEHPACDAEWTSQWSSACDDECGCCGAAIEAKGFTVLREITECADSYVLTFVDNESQGETQVEAQVETQIERPRA